MYHILFKKWNVGYLQSYLNTGCVYQNNSCESVESSEDLQSSHWNNYISKYKTMKRLKSYNGNADSHLCLAVSNLAELKTEGNGLLPFITLTSPFNKSRNCSQIGPLQFMCWMISSPMSQPSAAYNQIIYTWWFSWT